MDCDLSTSSSTIRSIHQNFVESTLHIDQAGSSSSSPKSSRSSGLPSPPDSPGSASSFPSVSSSFFFSSAAASPPHSHSDHARESTQGLIIPSLTLPSALKQPTPYGKTLGSLRLIFLSRNGNAETCIMQLLDDNPDIVDIDAAWEETNYGRRIHASTDWVEHHDPHGLERFEPTRNVEIVEIPGYEQDDDIPSILREIKSTIQAPFQALQDVLLPQASSTIVTKLLSSSSTPLFTALVLSMPSSSSIEEEIIDGLASLIPVILLHRPSSRHHHRAIQKLSSFRPTTLIALRTGLFRSSETIISLRSEAVDRYLEWRHVEEAVLGVQNKRRRKSRSSWSKASWESELEARLSQRVAFRLQEKAGSLPSDTERDASPLTQDPLHLPSLFVLSLSLLGPLQAHVGRAICGALRSVRISHLALLSGFCIGISTGIYMVQ